MASDRSLNEIITDINNTIKAAVNFSDSITAYGLCYQQTKGAQTFPLLNMGDGQGNPLHWNDKEPMRIYHRIIGPVVRDTDNSKGFGKNVSEVDIYTMRAVFIGTRKFLTIAEYEDNQEFMKAVKKAWPKFTTTREIITFTDSEVNKPTVYAEEYLGITLEHLSLDGIAFWINYEIRQKVC